MSISNYVKPCTKTISGNDHKIYVNELDNIATIGFDANNAITGLTIVTGTSKEFAVLEVDWDSTEFTAEGTSGRGFFSTQALTGLFSQKSASLDKMVDELRDAVTCGLVIIRKDGQGHYWVSGIAPADLMGGNRPYLSLTTNFTSGMSLEDVDEGNKYTITFNRVSATEEYLLGATLAGTMNAGSATFVNF